MQYSDITASRPLVKRGCALPRPIVALPVAPALRVLWSITPVNAKHNYTRFVRDALAPVSPPSVGAAWRFSTRFGALPNRLGTEAADNAPAGANPIYSLWLVGGLLGALSGAIVCLLGDTLGGMASALIALAAVAVMSGALHEDGLADTFDALAARKPPEASRAIARDSNIGAGGAIALMLYLMLHAALLQRLWMTVPSAVHVLALTALAGGLSRTVIALVCLHTAAAQPDYGSGKLIASTCRTRLWASVGWSLALAYPLCHLVTQAIVSNGDNDAAALAGYGVAAGLVLLLAISLLLSRQWRRSFGGITGDTLGASQKISEPLLLAALLIGYTYVDNLS